MSDNFWRNKKNVLLNSFFIQTSTQLKKTGNVGLIFDHMVKD